MRSRVLVLGRHEGIMAKVVRLLGDEGFDVTPTLTDEAALQVLESGAVDAFIIGGGVEVASRPALRELAQRQGVPIVEHAGGPAGLVEALRRMVAASTERVGRKA
jgi:TPP-dependent trihydroxycyclohexane-1,2-dione (THcHDO) dehydratase